MKKESKIFIAGITGMVGSAIYRKLEAEGYSNISGSYHRRKPEFPVEGKFGSLHLVQADLRRQAEVEALFETERPEYVFLAAAKVGGILANSTYKADFIYDNIMIASNVIHAAFRHGIKKLLNLGSSCIYPKDSLQPMKEESLLTGSLEPTNEPYAIAKIAAIKLCRYYNEQYKTNFLSVMPANLYGFEDNFNLETSHVLPALIRKFFLARTLKDRNFQTVIRDLQRFPLGFQDRFNENLQSFVSVAERLNKVGISEDSVRVWGTGEVFREFLHVDDLADACIFLMNHYESKEIGEFVNIGTGSDIKLKDLTFLIKDLIGFEGEIRFDSTKPDGVVRKCLDVSRMRKLGWMPKIELKEGIARTLRWYDQAVSGIAQ